MTGTEDKHEFVLKRTQLWIGVIAGLTTVIIGVYNVKNIFFPKKEPVKIVEPAKSGALRSAVEEVGASWLKELAAPKSKKSSY